MEIKGPAIPYNDGLWAIMLMRPSTLEVLSSWTRKSDANVKSMDSRGDEDVEELESSEIETAYTSPSISVSKQQMQEIRTPDPIEAQDANEVSSSKKVEADELTENQEPIPSRGGIESSATMPSVLPLSRKVEAEELARDLESISSQADSKTSETTPSEVSSSRNVEAEELAEDLEPISSQGDIENSETMPSKVTVSGNVEADEFDEDLEPISSQGDCENSETMSSDATLGATKEELPVVSTDQEEQCEKDTKALDTLKPGGEQNLNPLQPVEESTSSSSVESHVSLWMDYNSIPTIEPEASSLSKPAPDSLEEESASISINQEQIQKEIEDISGPVSGLELSASTGEDKTESESIREKTQSEAPPVDGESMEAPAGRVDEPIKEITSVVQSTSKSMQAVTRPEKKRTKNTQKAVEKMKKFVDPRKLRDIFVCYFVLFSGSFIFFRKQENSTTVPESGEPKITPKPSIDVSKASQGPSANNSYTSKSSTNNNNARGQNSPKTSQKSNQISPTGGSGSGAGGVGGGGGSGGGGDKRGNLPDEPADGYGSGDNSGILIVVAAVALVGVAIQKWMSRKRGRDESSTVVSRRQMVAGALRGGGNSVVDNESITQDHHHCSVREAAVNGKATAVM